jgi:hypothetical protein
MKRWGYHEARPITVKNVAFWLASVFRFVPLLAICSLAYGFQQAPADSAREEGVYAIYSLMLTNPQTSHGADTNERYLIAAITAPTSPQDPCIRPPKERETEFEEARTDYERRKTIPRQLKAELLISKPYVLLSSEDATKFIQSRMGRASQNESNERFKGVTDLFTLSDIYFNERGTLALTGISTFCGGLCGLFQWKVFEKMDSGKWEERRWATCTTVAGVGDLAAVR